MPRLINTAKVERPMSNDSENGTNGMFGILTQPSKTLANWYFWLGALGLMLAILNLLGQIHPTYRVSWGGMFTFEYTNAAFGDKDTASAFVLGDAVFIAGCLGLVVLGARSLIGDKEPVDWFVTMISNDWYNDLIDVRNGWLCVFGTWAMLGSIMFYFYWGIMYTAWIDPGVYSIAISLMATGLVFRMLSSIEDDE